MDDWTDNFHASRDSCLYAIRHSCILQVHSAAISGSRNCKYRRDFVRRSLSFAPALRLLFVLFVIITSTSYPVSRLVIPTNVTGTQGDCLRLTERSYRESWAQLYRTQKSGTAEINKRRNRTLNLLSLIESIPGIQKTKELADWIMDIVVAQGFDAAENAINAYYDNEIGILVGIKDNSRRLLNKRTNKSISHCRTLPLTHSPSGSRGEEGPESDYTQLFNQNFNWDAWDSITGNNPCGNYSSTSLSMPRC